MTRTHVPYVTVMFGACVWIAGCGGAAPESGSEAPETAAPAASSAPSRNACGLVDREALETIAEVTLDMLHNIEADDLTVCELSDASDHTELIYVTVHWTGGKALADVNASAMGMARQMLNDGDADIEQLTGSGAVGGLGDAAYYSDVMPSWVLEGDVLVEVLSPRFPGAKTKAVFLSVAKSAIAGLS